MPQMPESFKPIDMPESFKPIDLGTSASVEPEQPGILSRTWEAANKPVLDIRSGGLREATDQFAEDHPILGGGSNLLLDAMSSLTSPLNLGLTALTGGAGLAGKLGLTRTAKALELPAKAAAAGMVGQGGYNLVRPDATIPERVGGAAEAGLGALGLRGSKPKVELQSPKIEPVEVPKVDAAQPNLPIDIGVNPNPLETKLLDLLDSSKPLNSKQRELYRSERATKFGKAGDVKFEQPDDIGKFFGSLKGEHSKVTIQPLSDSLSSDEIWQLQQKIGQSSLPVTGKAQALTGFRALTEGGVPTDSQIAQLEKVFGDEFGARTRKLIPTTGRRAIIEVGGGMKSLMSAADFGFPFRQGINYAGRPEWFRTFVPMVKSYISEGKYNQLFNELQANSKHADLKAQAGLAITDLKGLTTREESTMSTWAERIPVLGNLARRSNRAFTIAADKLRNDVFDTMYDDYKRLYDSRKVLAGTDPEAIKLAEMLNPDNPFVASKMADQINVATGRGSLGRFEKIAPELNATLFAPRLISARVRTFNRVFNPFSYPSYNPVERKEALKQLISITGTAITAATLGKLAGADVSLDPNNSDFLKVKVGNTRIDPLGGYQQYFVPVAKILMGKSISPKSGEETDLRTNPLYGTWDVAENALLNKTSPLAGLGVAILKGREQSGEPTDFTTLNPMNNSASKRFLPMLSQDLYELLQEDPKLWPTIIPGSLGMGVQSFGSER